MPGTITYTAGTNTIRATQGTSSAPVTCADVLAADVANGWNVITSPATGVYLLNANLEIGDGVTASYFRSLNEFVRFADEMRLLVKSNATLQSGDVQDGYGIDGTQWDTYWPDNYISEYGSTLLFYASTVRQRSPRRFLIRGTTAWISSTLNRCNQLYVVGGTHTFTRCDFMATTLYRDSSPIITLQDTLLGGGVLQIQTLTNPIFIGNAQVKLIAVSNPITTEVINPTGAYTPNISGSEDNAIAEKFPVSLLLRDPSGNALANATATLVDQFGTQVFSLTSDANGATAEQAVTVKQWVGTDETLTEFNPFTLTISHADYPTMTIPGLTISAPLRNWRIDMGMSTAQVQAAMAAAMTAQGYTDTRAEKIDNLDAAVSTRSTLTSNDIPEVSADTIRGALGMAEANLDEQLGNVPTNDEFEARTLPSGEYATASAVAALGAGNGSIEWSYTVTHGTTGAPISDVLVRVTTDAAGLYSIAQGRTNQYGVVTFQLDPGTVYLWLSKSGWTFNNPDTEVVA